MKIRTGHVSNSSSSSFIVIIRDDCKFGIDKESMAAVTREQERLLYGYGFRYIKKDWRHALVNGAETFDDTNGFGEKDPISMAFDIICNQQDVMDFLFENHVPFVESEEYGTRTVCYDGIHDYYDTYVNAGNRFLIYGLHNRMMDDLDRNHLVNSRAFYRTRISDGKDITDGIPNGYGTTGNEERHMPD